MVGVIFWVTMGALVGWIASLFLKQDETEQRPSFNIVAGALGALLGGFTGRLIGGNSLRVDAVFSFRAVLASVVGAFVFILIVNFVQFRLHAPH
jgi:uncharacterized membrane protein YeaQ/YmgE (transglycosylase-associated protein family)